MLPSKLNFEIAPELYILPFSKVRIKKIPDADFLRQGRSAYRGATLFQKTHDGFKKEKADIPIGISATNSFVFSLPIRGEKPPDIYPL